MLFGHTEIDLEMLFVGGASLTASDVFNCKSLSCLSRNQISKKAIDMKIKLCCCQGSRQDKCLKINQLGNFSNNLQIYFDQT